MKRHLITTICMMGALLSGCASYTPHLSNKEKAIIVQDNLGTADRDFLHFISDDHYIEHNLNATPGKAGLVDFLDHTPTLPKNTKSNVVRAFEDGDYVVLHSYLKAINAVTFDVFRFENGQIVEHWDNIQAKADKPNPSGHTQTDGATQITDLDKTQQNKTIVKHLIEEVLIKGKFDKITQYINEDSYTQHNTGLGDGIKALADGFAAMAAQGQSFKYNKIQAILGQGNFVLAISSGEINGAPTSFYDLFRIANGKAVEHWDVIEPILAKNKQMNTNGKFNFPPSAMKLSQ